MTATRASALVCALGAVACMPRDADGRAGLAGRWEVELTCDAPVDGLDACDTTSRAFVTLFEPADERSSLVAGDHRALWPGLEAPDGSYAGVTGSVLAAWEGPELVLELLADADDPLLSPGDDEAWAQHRLRLTGRPGDRCWTARWSWTQVADDVEVAGGDALLARRFRTCD